ncbi:Lrp/AsnC family transcriptional regulator [Sporomusa termitida]|uniref:DNA-binding transcriptional activator DecR n=1 Tax=Sporomusa termitida TaxID=2377 RepID=A0A517DXY7_9FIRM|nr:Lrp/AsnC family transcriptional regulator [Sporomusa termitida]QDR82221.1 DNA-binding transcriptional activator DecR [Sporomusa termitida]
MKELLDLLEKDCTQPLEQLAALLRRSQDEVAAQIKQLEAEKVIVKYQPIINWEQVGEDRVTAIIDVRITPQREVGFDAIAERICRFPEVVTLYLMSGAYDLSVMVEGHTLKEVSQFVATKLSTIDGVISTTTHFMLKRYKYAGVIIEDREDDRRLVVSP